MESSRFSRFYCPIRKIEVAATPEENVRQRLVRHMLGPLGYPKGLLAVEKNLFSGSLERRIDLVCFYRQQDFLKPLLLVECKAESLTVQAENQLFGYNAQIGAPFLCLVSESAIKLFWKEAEEIKTLSYLPPYRELLRHL